MIVSACEIALSAILFGLLTYSAAIAWPGSERLVRMFRIQVGMTPARFVQQARLDAA